MDWQPTTNNPLGIYFDAGPVVVGIDTDDGGGESLQVTGPTSLDGGLITTDGSGNLTTTDGGQIVATDADQDATCHDRVNRRDSPTQPHLAHRRGCRTSERSASSQPKTST